jgi:hypothetical protein
LLNLKIDKVISADGFLCEFCGTWVAVAYRTVSLMEQMRKLMLYPPGHPKFKFLFAKVLRKAEGVNQRGEKLLDAVTPSNQD